MEFHKYSHLWNSINHLWNSINHLSNSINAYFRALRLAIGKSAELYEINASLKSLLHMSYGCHDNMLGERKRVTNETRKPKTHYSRTTNNAWENNVYI